MNETRTLLTLMGEVALLLWGVHMVQTGVSRAFGPALRRFMTKSLRGRWRPFLAGLGVTAILQSSTAVGLMSTGFVAAGAMSLAAGLAVMLGANVGTALIVQALSFDVSFLFPILILVGVAAFGSARQSRTKDLARVGIGLGLMLLALRLVLQTMTPMADSQTVRVVLEAVTRDPVFDMLLAALFAWAAHSSIAAVLVIMSLAAGGAIAPQAALAMVAGANLGSALNPLMEAGRDPVHLRLPLANLANRLIGCVLVLPLLPLVTTWLGHVDAAPARMAANFHAAFNLVLALGFIAFTPQIAERLERWLPARDTADDPGAPRHLDPAALANPTVALANAERETLRMADAVEAMLRGAADALRASDRRKVSELRNLDDTVDKLHGAIEAYLMNLDPADDEGVDRRRYSEILAFALNLEHAGDIIEKSLLDLAGKRIKQGVDLSAEGAAEIEEMIAKLLENLRLATTVFMSGHVDAAEQLLRHKKRFGELQRAAALRRFDRLSEESVEAAGLRLDILRDLKRINSHLSAAAYPVLERRSAA